MTIPDFFVAGIDTSRALPATHEPSLVAASYLIATLAGFAFLRFTSRIIELEESVIRFAWMIAGALTMGLGVWAMHFVAMLAYRLPIPVAYDPIATAASALPAVIGSAVALYIVAKPTVTTLRLLLGGIFMGAGIGAMHYMGMAAMRLDAFVRYDPILFLISILVAVALAFIALSSTLWTMGHGAGGPTLRRETAGALVMGLAVSGMHYTAMTSAFCFAVSRSALGLASLDPQVFAAVTTAVAVLVLLMAISGVVFDRRLSLEIAHRRHAQGQLQQAQKMEAIGQLTGGMAHDFNNLLAIIIGNLGLLKEILPAESKETSLADAALDSALRGADLNKRLLAFARRQSLQPERVDVGDVLDGMTNLLNRAIGERIVVKMWHGAQIWPVKVDLAQLESAIINLAVNARDAMVKGGALIIETANVVIDQVYRASRADAKLGDYVCISVSDTGVRMSPEIQARAFEPFFTTKPIDKGSGLGLSMVFGFVQQSGGHVNIYSELGRGTVIRLYLPRAEGVARAARTRAGHTTPSMTVQTGTETILAVEDNAALSEITTRQLADLGYRVIEARTAAHALEIIDADPSIKLLFTDVIMPGSLDGIALAYEAKRRRPALKILLTSGFTHRASEWSAQEAGIALPARLLTKPYGKRLLADSIRQALDE